MFAARYFNPRYWAERYWPKVGADVQHTLAAECLTVTVAADPWLVSVPSDAYSVAIAADEWLVTVPACED